MEVGSFQHYWTSLLPSALLMTWPRLFADAHHNSKDVLFLSLMVWIWIGLDTIWQGKTVKRWSLIWPWILLGIASTIRLSGLLIFGCAVLISALQWVGNGRLFLGKSDEAASETKASRGWVSLGWMNLRRLGLGWVDLEWSHLRWSEFRNRIFIPMVLFVLGYVVTYPYLWVKGWTGFVEILQFGTQNPWKHPTLFLGDWVNTETDGQPMFYLPVWILVTISEWILVVLLAVLLHVWPSNRVWKQPIVFFSLLVLMAFLGYTVVFQPVLYNGWRHLYFLVVPLITFIGIGASAINHKRLIPIHLLLAGYCIFSIIEPNKEDIQKGKLSLGYVSASSDFNVLARLFMDDKQKSKDELTSVDVAGPDIHTMDTGNHIQGISDLDENAEETSETGGRVTNPRFNNLGSAGILSVNKWCDDFPFSGDYWQHTTLQAYQFLLKKFPRSWIIVSGKGEGLWLNSLKERVWIWVVFNEEGVVQVPDIGDGRVVADAFRGNHWLWRAYQPQIQ